MSHIKPDDIVIYPTDTVWGIGCSIYSESGYREIAAIKKTQFDKPLSIMFSSVEQVKDFFNLPKEITDHWLEKFFSLEATIGFPLAIASRQIPKWAVANSSYVSIRVLGTNPVRQIYNEIKVPFFTTSLNLSGEPPITEMKSAKKFHENYAPEAHFIPSLESQNLSGVSSSIVFLNDNLSFEIIRKGRLIKEIENVMVELFTP